MMFRVIGHRENYRHSKRVLFKKLNFDVSFLFRHKSHYTSLGLDSKASPQDIKAAYYKLSLKYHPDKNQGSVESVEKFREITEAYEILSNQNKKKIYDESLHNPYSDADWRREHYSPRSYQYNERRSKPRTGRSQYYNYDEHYKQHYEEYEKMRQADYEYFKSRWEADFRRRYPFAGKPDWSEYERRKQEYENFDWKNVKLDMNTLFPKKHLLYFLSLWITIFIFTIPYLDEAPAPVKTPKKPITPIYYKVRKDDNFDEKPNES